MLTRIYTEEDDKYVNAIELTWLLIVTEFIVAMVCIKVFDNEERKINFRRVFWYICAAVPSISLIVLIAWASIKVITL